MNKLVRVCDSLYCAEAEVNLPGGVRMNTRMTIVVLRNGKLFVHSPIGLDEAMAKEIETLGEVAYIVAPNLGHYLFFSRCAERFPRARTFATPGLTEKAPTLRVDEVLGDEPPRAWADEIEQLLLRGAPKMSEMVFFHKPTRTFIVSDLFFNILHPSNFATSLVLTLAGTRGRLARSRLWSFFVDDKKTFEACARQALAWNFDRLVMAHGDIVETNAAEKARPIWGA